MAFESGRYLTCDSGVLVARIIDVKQSRDRDFVVTDTGIHHVGGLSGIGRVLPMRATTMVESSLDTGAAAAASVVGPLCTPADVLNRQIELHDVAPDRLITIPNVGAYGLSASLMGFLSRPTPIEVVTRAGQVVAASRVVMMREEIAVVHESPTEKGVWDADFEKYLRSVLPRIPGDTAIAPESTLQSLGIDSLALVHLLTTVEAHYGVTVPDEALIDGRCDTPQGLWDVIGNERESGLRGVSVP